MTDDPSVTLGEDAETVTTMNKNRVVGGLMGAPIKGIKATATCAKLARIVSAPSNVEVNAMAKVCVWLNHEDVRNVLRQLAALAVEGGA